MQTPEIIGIGLLLALVAAIALIAVRRYLLARSGGIDVCWRTDLMMPARGWVFGQGRFDDRGFVLYRLFSPLPLAARVLTREGLVIGDRRPMVGTEGDLLPVGSAVLRCLDLGAPIELALSEQAVTGLRSWLESAPPQNLGIAERPGLSDR